MLNVAATEMKQRLGQYMESALTEPVVIEKSGRPSVVMISVAEFERMQSMEDAWWGSQATLAISGGFVGAEETARRLQERMNAEA